MASFEERKHAVLESLASDVRDKSRAGGVDAPIADLIHRINQHPFFFTTSSCSGRVSIFSEATPKLESVSETTDDTCAGATANGALKTKKKGGDWVYVSHETALEDEVIKNVQDYIKTMEHGLLVFRYEPFILALECWTPASAQILVTCALSAGFRESGITGMGKRNIVGVRCSIRMEVPIAQSGHLLVSEEYLRFLTSLANQKMELNRQRTDTFLTRFIDQVEACGLKPLSELEGGSIIGESSHRPLQNEDLSIDCLEMENYPSRQQSEHPGGKESKKKLSVLKGRQMRVLARIRALEDRLLLTTGPVGTGEFKTGAVQSPCSNTCSVHPIMLGGDEEASGILISKPESKNRDTKCTGSKTSNRTSPQWPEQDHPTTHGRGKSDGCSLPAAYLTVEGEAIKHLHCWSHSVVAITSVIGEPSLLVHGGFGGQGRHARQGTSLIFKPLTGELKYLKTLYSRPPRMAQVALQLGHNMIVVGGRQDPSTCLGDVCVLDINTHSWHYPTVTGHHFVPRHRHAAAMVGTNIYVFGGIGENSILGDLCMLNTDSWEWKVMKCEGQLPCPRHSHSLATIGQKLYLFGGRDARRALGDFHILCLEKNIWTEVKLSGDLSAPRFSHSMTTVGKWLIILGGCPIAKHGTDLILFDVEHMVSKKISLMPALSDVLLVRHSATFTGTELVVIGGGAACFAFGAKFNPPFSIDLKPILEDGNCTTMIDITTGAGRPNNSLDVPRVSLLVNRQKNRVAESTWVLLLDKNRAKVGKDALKKVGWLDETRKPKVLKEGSHVAFPISEAGALFLQDMTPNCSATSHQGLSNGSNQASLQEFLLKLVASGGEVVKMQVADVTKCPISPLSTLERDVSNLLQEVGLPKTLLEELPKRWERLGDMAILPGGSLNNSSWSLIGPDLWTTIAAALGVKRVARQAPVAATKTRDSKLQVLWGEDGWVEHRENGILYCFDATKCMFSSGNVSEKLRMAGMKCTGETVIDLFAGIGYYVLPFLVKAEAKKVYACEWNPNAIVALRHNLQVNRVESRCSVIEGDNRLTAPQGVADRVCLGLLPSSEGSWNVALRALRPEGGVLHVHENVKDTDENQWVDYLISTLDSLSATLGRQWEIRVMHVERVKWYAPHIRHLVVDVHCFQHGK